MAYEKQHWINDVTPLNASRMNHIEDGIEDAHSVVPENEGANGYVLTKTSTGVEWSAAGMPHAY